MTLSDPNLMEREIEEIAYQHSDPGRGQRLGACLVLVMVTLAVHVLSLGHPFISMDDPANVAVNPIFTSPDFRLTDLAYFWVEDYAGLYIPVTYTFWGVEAFIEQALTSGGAQSHAPVLGPTIFHMGNLLLHVANTLLVYFVLRRWVPGIKGPLLGSLFFAVHPLHVETVSWVTETKGLLAAAFSLVAYLQYLASVESSTHRRWRQIAAMLCYILAMLSKPTAVTLPFIVFTAEVLIRRQAWRDVARGLITWVLLGIVVVVVTQRVQSHSMLDVEPTGVIDRLRIAGDALAFYIVKLIFPFSLVPDYGRTPPFVLSKALSWFAWLLPAVLLLAVLPLRRRNIYLAAMAIFVLSLAPVLGLIPFSFQAISTVADRYTYFALLGPSLALAAWYSVRTSALSTGLAVGVIFLYSVLSWQQTGYWQSDRALFSRTLAVNDHSVLAANALGNVESSEGDFPRAIDYYTRAIEIDPTSAEAWFNLGASHENLGDFELALKSYHRSLLYRPGSAKAQRALARVLVDMGRFDQAAATLEELIEKIPTHYAGRLELAVVYQQLERPDAAEHQYRIAIQQAPDQLKGYTQLAALLGSHSKWLEAAEVLSQAVERFPQEPDAWFNLGTAYLFAGRYQESVAALQRAVELNPNDQVAVDQLARAMEASGELSEPEATRQ